MAAAGLLALLVGCDGLPRDPEGTLQDIHDSGQIRLGIVQGAAPDAAAQRRLDDITQEFGAEVRVSSADGETLLRELEHGRLHLVYGRFAANSPWRKHVHLGQVPGRAKQPAKDIQAPRFAYRNGENGWIMAVEGVGP
jgi:hypothetical protein